MYGKEGDLVYDSFMGIGTTAIGAILSNGKMHSDRSLRKCFQ